jgi:FAD:protein FMN transferase
MSSVPAPPLSRFAFKAMGSPCEIQLYAADQAQAQVASERAIAEVERLEARYSRFRSDSLLAAINRVAGTGGSITVDEETAGLIHYADTCFRQSDGLFDITSGVLRRVWRFDQNRLPDRTQIEALLDKIGWQKVRWDSPRLEFPRGMELDLGGVVKEYAADRVAALLWNGGTRHGLVNLGGDVRIVGPPPDGSSWHVGVQHPRDKGAAIGTLALTHGAVATSGDYERCIIVEGVRYGHVINPKTGWPVRHMASVTVVGNLCVVAGSASTIGMLKEEEGPAWLERLGLPCCWIDVHGQTGGSLAPDWRAATPAGP